MMKSINFILIREQIDFIELKQLFHIFGEKFRAN